MNKIQFHQSKIQDIQDDKNEYSELYRNTKATIIDTISGLGCFLLTATALLVVFAGTWKPLMLTAALLVTLTTLILIALFIHHKYYIKHIGKLNATIQYHETELLRILPTD